MSSFAERLAHLRTRKGWSQPELAARAAVPYMTVYRAEARTHRYPRVEIVKRLALALGVSLDVLCGLYEVDDEE